MWTSTVALTLRCSTSSLPTRLLKAHRAAAVTHAASTQEENNLGSNSSQNKACNYKEFCAVMHENFYGTEDGALTGGTYMFISVLSYRSSNTYGLFQGYVHRKNWPP
ncbi:hypothetical protein Tco_1386611 [Tanacetum coccineum]